ncbi:lamin tail domain-containing protein [Candidatus Bipolaricaulota bacterium]|nr:lamin tail domain-containing protein [Candidatus Bipolaricaulota bacterium]
MRKSWRKLARGLFIGFLFSVLGFMAFSQEKPVVIINEFGQGKGGNGEWIELLVLGTGPKTTVDMRGFVLRDRQGDARGGVFITFSQSDVWAAIPAGTLIVIYNHNDKENLPEHFPEDDFDFSDFVVVLPANAEGLFITSRWEGLANAGDIIILLDAQGEVVHSLSYGNVPEVERRPLHLSAVERARAAFYVGATQGGVDDPENWQVGPDASGSSTPGFPNTEAQDAWIEALRMGQ